MFNDNGVITPVNCVQRVTSQPNPTIYLAPGWEIATTQRKIASATKAPAENRQEGRVGTSISPRAKRMKSAS